MTYFKIHSFVIYVFEHEQGKALCNDFDSAINILH